MAEVHHDGRRSGPEEQRMQGHWLLAKLGKRVLRPGGVELTDQLLAAASPQSADRIVEFGPGVGHTAKKLLACSPASYHGIDPNPEGRNTMAEVLRGRPNASLVTAPAAETGLPDESADLVIGEAMLSMQTPAEKARIVADEGLPRTLLIAARLLTNPAARKRVMAMRQVFRKHADALTGIALVGRKPAG